MSYSTTDRDLSVDVFRGLTILVMIWVNDLASVSNIPAWLKHFPADGNGMTFVDIVFPAFLFVSGMSIPLSLKKSEKSLNIDWQEVFKIGKRGISLLFIGVLMVNIGSVNSELTGMSKYQWGTGVLLAVVLLFNTYFTGRIKVVIRIVAAIAIITAILLFKGGTAETPLWLRTQWWGIVGLIGWAYIFVSLYYVLSGRHLWAAGIGMVLFLLIYAADMAGFFGVPNSPDLILRPGIQIGGHGFIMCSGLFLGLMKKEAEIAVKRVNFYYGSALLTALLFLAGYLLSSVYGINKNEATPAWGLYSAGWCVILFIALFSIEKLLNGRSAVIVLSAAGANALMAYILPDIWYFLLQMSGLPFWSMSSDGVSGIFRSTIFAAGFIYLTAYLYKIHFRVKV